MKTEQDFFAVYERLEEEGECDAPGGIEYKRVLAEWIKAGRPDDIDAFVRRRANVRPRESN